MTFRSDNIPDPVKEPLREAFCRRQDGPEVRPSARLEELLAALRAQDRAARSAGSDA